MLITPGMLLYQVCYINYARYVILIIPGMLYYFILIIPGMLCKALSLSPLQHQCFFISLSFIRLSPASIIVPFSL